MHSSSPQALTAKSLGTFTSSHAHTRTPAVVRLRGVRSEGKPLGFQVSGWGALALNVPRHEALDFESLESVVAPFAGLLGQRWKT